MKNDKKLEQLKTLVARITQNVKDIESLDMADLTTWATLESKAKMITDDLKCALPLAAESQPLMVAVFNTMKEAVVNMRIDVYNTLNDVTQSIAAGKPVHQDKQACESMLGHGISDYTSQRAIEFCLHECPYQRRCIALRTPAERITSTLGG